MKRNQRVLKRNITMFSNESKKIEKENKRNKKKTNRRYNLYKENI